MPAINQIKQQFSEPFSPLDMFVQHVQQTPDRIAVSLGNSVFTYNELNDRVNVIAAVLASHGVKYRSVVALALDHDINLIAAPLAILRLGAVYLPLDKRHPAAHLVYVLQDAQPAVVLANTEFIKKVTKTNQLCLDIDSISNRHTTAYTHHVAFETTSPAYIIYTSGSTGKPKGVVVSRGNMANYCDWATDRYFKSKTERIALYSALSFDFTATCIFPPLMKGCSIEVYDGINNPYVIKDILDNNRVQIIKITPAYLQVLAELVNEGSKLKRLIVGGEDLKTKLAEVVKSRIKSVEIINEYGPTEATVGCMNHVYSSQDNEDHSVPIGKAISGVQIEILNSDFERTKDNEIGEIYILGDSVAMKYLNNQQANDDSFLNLPIFANQKCYRTGDLARRNIRGDLIFVGRKDSQVKIRGNRVELGDVEANMNKLPYVKEVHVNTINNSYTSELVAAVVLNNSYNSTTMDKHKITSDLAEFLPDHMIPRKILIMENLPMSNNQKVDQNAIMNNLQEMRHELVT